MRFTGIQSRQHIRDRYILIPHRDVNLVEHNQIIVTAFHQFPRLGKSRLSGGDIAFLVLGIPGEAFAHGVPSDLAQAIKEYPFAGFPFAFDELDDAHLLLPAQCAHHDAKGAG